MKTEKPKVQTVYVTATDAKTRKSAGIAVYGMTVEQVIRWIKTGGKK